MFKFKRKPKQFNIGKVIIPAGHPNPPAPHEEDVAKLLAHHYETTVVISAYENSVRLPSYDVLTKIALFFNVSIDYLFGVDKRQFLDTTGLTESQIRALSILIDEFKAT